MGLSNSYAVAAAAAARRRRRRHKSYYACGTRATTVSLFFSRGRKKLNEPFARHGREIQKWDPDPHCWYHREHRLHPFPKL
jgi:hypothetical protein